MKNLQIISAATKRLNQLMRKETENPSGYPVISDETFEESLDNFLICLFSKSFELQEKEGFSSEDRFKMAGAIKKDIHRLVKVYTGIDLKFEFLVNGETYDDPDDAYNAGSGV